MSDANGMHLPIYGVTLGQDWLGVNLDADTEQRLRTQGIYPCTVFGTEPDARKFIAAESTRRKLPKSAFRIVRYEVADVLEG
jgi:hypothetical protein